MQSPSPAKVRRLGAARDVAACRSQPIRVTPLPAFPTLSDLYSSNEVHLTPPSFAEGSGAQHVVSCFLPVLSSQMLLVVHL